MSKSASLLSPFFILASGIAILACGSSSETIVEPEPEFAQKLSNFLPTTQGVLFAAEVSSGRFELFYADVSSGALTGISDEFSPNRGLKSVALSPDGSLVGYRADKNFDGVDELYVNALNGRSEVMLVDELPTTTLDSLANGSGQLIERINWQWSPDSSRIIFQSDLDNTGAPQIYSIAIDGTDLVSISGSLIPQCFSTECWKASPDGSYITFLSETGNGGSVNQNIYLSPTLGGSQIRLNQLLSSDSRIKDWQWSADNTSVYYVSQNLGSPAALYSVSPDGINRTLISQNGVQDGVYDYAVSAALNQIIFREDTNFAGIPSLFSVGTDGLNRVELIDRETVPAMQVESWLLSPANQRVAYIANQEDQNFFELFTVELDGDWHRKINFNLLPDGDIQTDWFWSSDGVSLAYFADVDSLDDFDELYVGSDDGASINRVNLSITAGASIRISDAPFAADNARVVYQVENSNNQIEAIYSVLTDGSQNIRLTDSLSGNDYVFGDYLLSSDTNRILFRQYQQVDNLQTLHLSEVTSGQKTDLVTLGRIEYFSFSGDESKVIYQIKLPGENSEQLFSVDLNGANRIKLY